MSSWLSSAIQSVREKSLDALDFVRRDLTEFTSTVKTDTESYLNVIKSQEVSDLRIDRLVSKWTERSTSENDDAKHIQTSASFDRVHNELARVQNEESTYLVDPVPIEPYEAWRQTSEFNVETRKGDIAKILIDAGNVRALYARLVPAHTTHADFWSRYYYRLHQLEEEEARRTQLLKRAHKICTETTEETDANGDNGWDEPDETWTGEPLPTAIQKPLVADPPSEPEEPVEPIVVRKESDTVSGDSWEAEFDETGAPSTQSEPESLVEPTETVTPSPPAAAATVIMPPKDTVPIASSRKKAANEFDEDEWDSWS